MTDGNSAATALGAVFPAPESPAAANTAADPPKPCPAIPSLVGWTLIRPGPSRTPVMMSSVVPRSKARFSTEGAGPRSVLGAAATMPHDARCCSVLV